MDLTKAPPGGHPKIGSVLGSNDSLSSPGVDKGLIMSERLPFYRPSFEPSRAVSLFFAVSRYFFEPTFNRYVSLRLATFRSVAQ